MTMGAVSPLCAHASRAVPFLLKKKKRSTFFPLSSFLLLLFIHLLCVCRRTQQRNATAFGRQCWELDPKHASKDLFSSHNLMKSPSILI